MSQRKNRLLVTLEEEHFATFIGCLGEIMVEYNDYGYSLYYKSHINKGSEWYSDAADLLVGLGQIALEPVWESRYNWAGFAYWSRKGLD